jgi:hypothetical protein
MITQTRLKELFFYDPEIGVFTRLQSKNGQEAGKPAGWLSTDTWGNTYIRMSVDGKIYSAHRLVYMYCYGAFPSDFIDHIDGNGAHNKLCNLRNVDRSQNMQNQKRSSANTSGVTGVYKTGKSKWRAMIFFSGSSKYLGSFDSKEEAVTARKKAEKEAGFHKNHGRA